VNATTRGESTILVVDDRQDNLFVLGELIKYGLPECRVVTATSASAGLSLAQATRFDGALIDVQMPEMGGIEMCRRLKADPATRDVHVILITSHAADVEVRTEGLNAGADDFVSRPVDNAELIARLNAMLRIRRAEEDLRELNKRLDDLVTERVKELRCLYGVAKSVSKGLTLEGIFEEVVALLPLGLRYPEIARARIRFGDRDYVSSTFEEGEWRHSADILLGGEPRGAIEVFYLEDPSGQAEGSFSEQERELIAGVGSTLSAAVDRHKVDKERERLALAIDHAKESVVVTDIEGAIQYANPAFEQLTGHSRSEALGQNPSLLKSGEHSDAFNKELWETIRRGDTWRGHYVNKKKDGTRFVVEGTISAVLDAAGRPVNYVTVEHDITERTRVEEELARERANLERTVAERTQELRDTLGRQEETSLRLEEASRHKDRFLSTMSHELRTPLNAILGYDDLLGGGFAGPLNEKQKEYVRQIENSGRHLLTLINDLLDLAKVAAGATDVTLEALEPGEFIQASLSMIDVHLQRKQLVLETSIEPEVQRVRADRKRCIQILLNLLSNAVKFTPEGGRIGVRVALQDESTVRIEVTDSGVGIAADQTEKVFLEFYQAERLRDQRLGGAGIGLALARHLVELQGGEIGVESELAKGSSFWFTLPAATEEPGAIDSAEGAPEQVAGEAKAPRILVVDDSEPNVTLIQEMLSIQGYEVLVASNGREAVELVRSSKPDLILMDVHMPVMDGLEATQRIRRIPECALLPIVCLTGSTGPDEEARQRAAGCTGHLAKPFRLKELFAVLKEHLV
jgi:PAS domain S-box-containing protein